MAEEEEDFHRGMPGAARESSRRSESTYLQRAHNEGQRIKQKALIRALEGRRKALGGSRPLLRKSTDCHWGKSFKHLSRVLGLPRCQGGEEIHYRDLNSLHIQELQNRHEHPLQLYLSVIENFWANLNTFTGAHRGCSQLEKCQLYIALIAFHGPLVTKASLVHRNQHTQHLTLEISSPPPLPLPPPPTWRIQVPSEAGPCPSGIFVSWASLPTSAFLWVSACNKQNFCLAVCASEHNYCWS